MAPSNSTKKLAKVARSSKGRSIRESRDRTFPAVVALIVVLGTGLVFYGRNSRMNAQEVLPRLGQDHWHAAYGVYLCDSWAPNLTDRNNDEVGIHTHDDGVIHIHPNSSLAAGERSKIGRFFDEVNLDVDGGTLRMPDKSSYVSGETACPDGSVGKLVLAKWDNANDSAAQPEVITEDIANVRFTSDRMAFTLAFVPEAKIGEIPRPESIPNLDNLSDMPGQVPGAEAQTLETTPDGTATTGDGGATTTAPSGEPGDATTSTAAGESTTTGAPTTTAG